MSLQIPDYQIARPLSLIDALEERSRLEQSRQQQKLNEMKLRAAQEEMDRDTAFRGAFSNGSPSPADLYRIDPEKAAQYEKNQLGIQSGTREFLKGAATDLYNRAKLIQDPAQQQAAIDRYVQPLKPQLQRMGLPMNEPVTMDHLKMILGQTPEESQQANIDAKIAEKQGLFPYEMAETEAKYGAQLNKAKTLADYERGLKMEEEKFQQPAKNFEQEQKLASSYQQESKDFRVLSDAYQKTTQLFDKAKNSAPETLAAATAYMKLLDPGSVVRESELGLALNATGVIDKAMNYANKAAKGDVLTASQVEAFKDAVKDIYKAASQQQKKIDQHYKNVASNYGLNHKNIIQDVGQYFDENNDFATQYSNMPPGTVYTAPDGTTRRKP